MHRNIARTIVKNAIVNKNTTVNYYPFSQQQRYASFELENTSRLRLIIQLDSGNNTDLLRVCVTEVNDLFYW
jgi:hypothetical protein